MLILSVSLKIIDKIDRRPVLPFTTHDTCHATGISKSPSSNNIMRRGSSYDNIVNVV